MNIALNQGVIASQLDYDSLLFLNAAGITDPTIRLAINYLTFSLKVNGLWTKLNAIYPFVGGTAATHKFNLKNPADTDAAFRLSFVGGWTHSSTGALPNGTNAVANTFFNAATSGSQNSTSLSYYSRTNSNLTEIEIGAANNATQGSLLEIRTTNVTYFRVNSGITYITAVDTDSRAFYMANRTASNVVNGWRNSTKVATGTVASTALFNGNTYLGALNESGVTKFYSRKECAFASIGLGLTATERTNFYTIVQAYQTTLNRNV